MTRRTAHAASLVALVVALVVVPAAFAGKGGHGGGGTSSGSSLSLVMVTDNNGDGLPNWGDQVTFKVSTSAAYPSVELDCAQNGTWVYAQIVGFYPTYFGTQTYTLKSYYWTGGAADCTATLTTTSKNGSRTTLATMSFPVAA
jgi:hypothetical protein